jgi:uncharacterized protein (DUF983 family)
MSNPESLVTLAIKGGCPQCDARSLFDGPVSFAPKCTSCGLDIAGFNVGDGPAAFLIMIVGAIVTIGAIWLQLAVEPPFWVHILIWLPVTAALVIGLLRVAKAALLIIEYRRSAHEGRKVD